MRDGVRKPWGQITTKVRSGTLKYDKSKNVPSQGKGWKRRVTPRGVKKPTVPGNKRPTASLKEKVQEQAGKEESSPNRNRGIVSRNQLETMYTPGLLTMTTGHPGHKAHSELTF